MENKSIKKIENLEFERNKLLIEAEYAIGFTSAAALLAPILGVSFTDFNNVVKAIFIVSGTTYFVVGITFALKIEQIAGYYKCSKCNHEYVPEKYSKVLFAPHIGTTRYMKCPECDKRSWQKKVLVKNK